MQFLLVFLCGFLFLVYYSGTGTTTSDSKAVSKSETLLIGSGPLPARAPPEKKTVTTQPLEELKVASKPPPPPPPSSSTLEAVASQPQPAKAAIPAPVPAPVPPPSKPVVSSASVPKLTQPMPLAGRPPLPNVARSVAAAFLEQEDDDTETTGVKTLTGIPTSGTTPGTSILQNYATAKKVETSRLTASKPPEPVPPPATSAVTTPSKSAMTKNDFIMGLSEMSFADMVLAAQMPKTAVLPYAKGLDPSKTRTAEGKGQSTMKTSYSSRQPRPTDSKGRKKLEIGRNVM